MNTIPARVGRVLAELAVGIIILALSPVLIPVLFWFARRAEEYVE